MSAHITNAELAESISELKKHLDEELKKQNKKIEELIDLLKASKLVAKILTWCAGIASAIGIIYASFWHK